MGKHEIEKLAAKIRAKFPDYAITLIVTRPTFNVTIGASWAGHEAIRVETQLGENEWESYTATTLLQDKLADCQWLTIKAGNEPTLFWVTYSTMETQLYLVVPITGRDPLLAASREYFEQIFQPSMRLQSIGVSAAIAAQLADVVPWQSSWTTVRLAQAYVEAHHTAAAQRLRTELARNTPHPHRLKASHKTHWGIEAARLEDIPSIFRGAVVLAETLCALSAQPSTAAATFATRPSHAWLRTVGISKPTTIHVPANSWCLVTAFVDSEPLKVTGRTEQQASLPTRVTQDDVQHNCALAWGYVGTEPSLFEATNGSSPTHIVFVPVANSNGTTEYFEHLSRQLEHGRLRALRLNKRAESAILAHANPWPFTAYVFARRLLERHGGQPQYDVARADAAELLSTFSNEDQTRITLAALGLIKHGMAAATSVATNQLLKDIRTARKKRLKFKPVNRR